MTKIDYDTSENQYWNNAQYQINISVVKVVKMSWLNENMSAIEMGIPVPFIRERRFTEGYKKTTTTHEGYNGGTYKTSCIERIDNNSA